MYKFTKSLILLFLLTLLFVAQIGFSQSRAIDSLRQKLQYAKKDTSIVRLLNNFVYAFLNFDDCDSSLHYSQQSIALAKEFGNLKESARAKYYCGISLRCKQKYGEAYTMLMDAKQEALDSKNELLASKCQRNIGAIFQQQNKMGEALDALLVAMHMSEKVKDTLETMRDLRGISDIFYADQKYEKSLEYAKKFDALSMSPNFRYIRDQITEHLGYIYKALKKDSLSLHYQFESLKLSIDSKDTFGIGNSFFQLGDYYTGIGNLDSSSAYFSRAAEMYIVINDTNAMTSVNHSWGIAFLEKGFADSALKHLLVSHKLADINGDKYLSADNCQAIGRCYLKKKNYKKAESYFLDNLVLSRFLQEQPRIAAAYLWLSRLYDEMNEPYKSAKYLNLLVDIKDSIAQKERNENLLGLEAKVNFEKTVQENRANQDRQEFRSRVKIYSLLAGFVGLVILAFLLYRNSMQKQNAKTRIEMAYEELKAAQSQLVQREKMASLGELTAGIAHEIQNPLNFVNNFSDVNAELVSELKNEVSKTVVDSNSKELIEKLADDILKNQEKIIVHGKRADSIVKGMLQHSRMSAGQKEFTDINALADEYLRLAYHGLRAKDSSFNAKMNTDFDGKIEKMKVAQQDIGRVLLNIYNNAFYAVNEKRRQNIKGYEPAVSVSTKKIKDKIHITVRDNGNGIPGTIKEKIFQPFFTTKPTGQGTGLGLSLSYDIIVKGHGGELKVDTKENEFSEFTVILGQT